MDKDYLEEQMKQFKASVAVFCRYHRDLLDQEEKEGKAEPKNVELSKKDKIYLKQIQKLKNDIDNMRDAMKAATKRPLLGEEGTKKTRKKQISKTMGRKGWQKM